MYPLLSALARYCRRPHRTRGRSRKGPRTSQQQRLFLEVLEERTLLTAVAAPSGLVSWWTGNNTAADATGQNNATPTGMTYTTGEVGQAFSFDGTDDRAQIVDNPSLQFTTSFSIEGWVKVSGFPTGTNGDDHGEIFFRGDDRGGLDPYSLSVEPNGTLNFQVTDANNNSASLAAPITTGQFVHVAATLDDATGTMSLYENGQLVAQQVTTIRPFQNLDPTQNPSIAIGNHGGYPTSPHNFPFYGQIDELSVYNRALTPGEVLGIYKAGSDGKVISPISVDGPSVVDGSGGATTPVTFTITRTGSLSGPLTVNWATADDTAVAGTDYVAASGTVTFADGQATQTVQVTTLDSNVPKPNVDFKLIATPVGGTSIMGLGSIINDDASISVSSGSAVEGSSTLTNLGSFIDNNAGGLSRARMSTFGPDGNIYVASADTNAILRYSPSGEFINAFIPSGSGGLSSPANMAFAPDGSLYVSSYGNNEVLHYDSSGNFLGVVASGFSLISGVTLGPDGNLYIADQGANEVFQYNTSTATLSSFVSAGSGGLSGPRVALFGSDGNLYVASQGTSQVLAYNGQTGAYIGVFATNPANTGAMWMQFGNDGYLYVSTKTPTTGGYTNILRFNATTRGYVDSFTPARGSWAFSIGPNNIIYDSSANNNSSGGFVDLIGPSSVAAFPVSLAAPSAGTTTVNYATADGTALAGRDYVATSGTLTFAPGETSKTIVVPTLDDGGADPTKYFTLNLSNPTEGVITNGQAIGTILDDTKFYVVDGSSSDSTYQYASNGAALDSNALTSGDTTPRGVATTAAGTTEWVVDANKNVYVYSTGGALLGSWSAGGLSSSATLTGIATNGTDIWLVDSYSHKVYDYAGAASRLSGSQNAASSFKLASGNTNPQDIVTDGTSFWVVDGSKLKVFKYTLSGSLLGSWGIDPANTHPTGITINPNNVSDIWIVDNGTDKVYQYVGAASRTSGSQRAAATFALAAGNTNPQGIADPPPADMLLPQADTPSTPGQPTVPVSIPVPSVGTFAPARVPSLASRDVAFAQLAAESMPVVNDLLAGTALTSLVDRLHPVTDLAWTTTGVGGRQNPLESLAVGNSGSSQGVLFDGSAMGLQNRTLADEESQASEEAMDFSTGGQADESAAEE